MRIAIYGAGAIGGHLAARLGALATAATVSVVARPAHVAAIRAGGLTLLSDAGEISTTSLTAVCDARDLPEQDLVIVTLKAPALPAEARAIAQLLTSDGVALFLTNGIPWWMVEATGCKSSLLDPEGDLARHVGLKNSLGGIVYSSNHVVRPGVVAHVSHNRWLLGEVDGAHSARATWIAALFNDVGLNAEIVCDLQHQVWAKLMLNASANPLSALTRLLPGELAASPPLAAMMLAIRNEIATLAAPMGCPMTGSPYLGSLSDVLESAPVKPSMLQDVLNSRVMEVEAILGQPVLMAAERGLPCPVMQSLLPVIRGLNHAVARPASKAAG